MENFLPASLYECVEPTLYCTSALNRVFYHTVGVHICTEKKDLQAAVIFFMLVIILAIELNKLQSC